MGRDEGLVLLRTFRQRSPNPTLEDSKLWRVRLLGSGGEVVVVAILCLPREMALESCQHGCGSFSAWLGGTATHIHHPESLRAAVLMSLGGNI